MQCCRIQQTSILKIFNVLFVVNMAFLWQNVNATTKATFLDILSTQFVEHRNHPSDTQYFKIAASPGRSNFDTNLILKTNQNSESATASQTSSHNEFTLETSTATASKTAKARTKSEPEVIPSMLSKNALQVSDEVVVRRQPTLQQASKTRTAQNKTVSKTKVQKSDAPMLNYIFDSLSTANKHHHHDQRYGPHFEDIQRYGNVTNITIQAGSNLHLNCRISLLQDKTVSWVKRNSATDRVGDGEAGLELLTVGMHTYSGDKRFTMEFQYPNNWKLKISNARKSDQGTYECQVSTHPPRVIQVNLHINDPKVMIVDEHGAPLQDKYYEADSTLQLSCIVRNVAMSHAAVLWSHGNNVLNYDTTRGGVSVKTEIMENAANSTLFIAKITESDSGNYTCSISSLHEFVIVVHILKGESFAELHHGNRSSISRKPPEFWLLQICNLLYITLLYLNSSKLFSKR